MNKVLSAVVFLLIAASGANGLQNAYVTFTGPSPWMDVTSYGAKCDGKADDTGAIQAALNAANNAKGATVRFPSGGCLFTNLAIDNFNNVSLEGAGYPGLGVTRAAILHSTAGGRSAVISARGIRNVQFRNIAFYNDNPLQTGPMIDNSPGTDQTAFVTYDHVWFGGIAGATNMAQYLKLDQSIEVNILYSMFGSGAAVYIQGAANNTSFNTACNIVGNDFNPGVATASGVVALQNLVANCNVIGNTFEIGGGTGLIPTSYTSRFVDQG